jgi:hypothetical protein
LLSIYRSVNSYVHLADAAIETSPLDMPAHELGTEARGIIDGLNAAAITDFGALFTERGSENRAVSDISHAARAATFGAVETLLVDMDSLVPGIVDEATGAIYLDKEDGAVSYDVIDEIAGRVLTHGGRVLAARHGDIPHGAKLAAILRYAI